MEKLIIISVFTFSLLIISCGPNAEQKAAMQKLHDDSIGQVATQNAQQAQQQHDNDVINLKAYQQQLENKIADLEVARSQLKDLQRFHVGRIRSEKDNQIRNKTIEIENIQDNIKNIQTSISQIKTRLGNNN